MPSRVALACSEARLLARRGAMVPMQFRHAIAISPSLPSLARQSFSFHYLRSRFLLSRDAQELQFRFTTSASAVAAVKMEEAVKFVGLPDGRQIAYREQGLAKGMAKRSLLVLHGLGSSRVAGMPGVSEDLLKEMGVRLVSIDRPGYGLSDFNRHQTLESAANDIAKVADILELGQKIWLLGYSCGGAYCWAAARYIPHRIAGIAMWAPVGNYWWKGISEADRKMLFGHITPKSRHTLGIVRKVPHWMVYAYVRHFIVPAAGKKWVADAKKSLSPADVRKIEGELGGDMERDSAESAKQHLKGMAQDLLLITHDWGFELSDVQKSYQGPLHIFCGDQDMAVPLALQQCIKKLVPDLVHLHELTGEGHLSPFCFNNKNQRATLQCLFGSPGGIGEVGVDELQAVQQDQKNLTPGEGEETLTQALKADAEALSTPYLH